MMTSVLLGFAAADQPATKLPAKMPLTGLAPAKPFPDHCLLRYRISTRSPECQLFFDQGLGYLYSYVWMEAARSFETAVLHDPDCAIAWWGLARGLDRWNKKDAGKKALEQARDRLSGAPHNAHLLITAALQEKGLLPGLADAAAQKAAAIKSIDQLLSLYEDDSEGWFARAQLACNNKLFGGDVASAPFYKALVRFHPLHPGANHELLHYAESSRRPALGWINAENYIRSSPGIPHAFHMQAHLAMRLGRYEKSTDRSMKAVELERAYHREMNVKPAQDHQFSHHLETLTLGLIHDGRWAEARKIKAESTAAGYRHAMPWFRLHLGERNWDEARKIADSYRKTDKNTASYLAAVLFLKQGNAERAAPEVDVLREAAQRGKQAKQGERRLWETQGVLMCQTGSAEPGLKLLAKVVEQTKDDYSHHAWGNGAYYMETWGIAALKSFCDDIAEEAFLEALAHEPSCTRAALGLQVLCERQGRKDEAERYHELARRCWKRADPGALEAELADLRECYSCYRNPAPKSEP
jgi:tetratricopeptide (TPR) repeat protein